MRSSQQAALSVWVLHTSVCSDLLGAVVVVGNVGQNCGEQTPLPRNPQTHTCKQTQMFYLSDRNNNQWLKSSEENTKRQKGRRDRGIVGNR